MKSQFKRTLSIFAMATLAAFCLAANAHAWWDASWENRIKITFDKSPPSQDLSYFPVLIKLHETAPANIDYSQTKNQGEDIRFVASDDTTVLPHEIEKWDEEGDSYVWVKVPQIKSSAPYTYIYMYYDNSEADNGENEAEVWNCDPLNSDDDYKMVHHLEEDTGSANGILDSTENDRDGTPYSDTTITNLYTDSGHINGADAFDGGDENNPIEIGDTVTGQTGSGTGVVVNIIYLTAATGYLWYVQQTGTQFVDDEELQNAGADAVDCNGAPAEDIEFYKNGEIDAWSKN